MPRSVPHGPPALPTARPPRRSGVTRSQGILTIDMEAAALFTVALRSAFEPPPSSAFPTRFTAPSGSPTSRLPTSEIGCGRSSRSSSRPSPPPRDDQPSPPEVPLEGGSRGRVQAAAWRKGERECRGVLRRYEFLPSRRFASLPPTRRWWAPPDGLPRRAFCGTPPIMSAQADRRIGREPRGQQRTRGPSSCLVVYRHIGDCRTIVARRRRMSGQR